jgi:hypothetical protein
VTALPCRVDPDRWFDGRRRDLAALGCVRCPARRGCAAAALGGARFGMWAGVWLDGDRDAVARAALERIAGHRRPAAPPTPPTRPTMRALVMARASGCCEVMALGCRITADTVSDRVPGIAADAAGSPAAGYAVCGVCRDTVAALGVPVARELGYRVDGDIAAAAAAPFYWRQSHWVRLAGGICAAPAA